MFVWTIGDAISLVVLGLIVLIGSVVMTLSAIRKALCKHPSYQETSACDAICTRCGKNLGFIGSVRQKHAARHATARAARG